MDSVGISVAVGNRMWLHAVNIEEPKAFIFYRLPFASKKNIRYQADIAQDARLLL